MYAFSWTSFCTQRIPKHVTFLRVEGASVLNVNPSFHRSVMCHETPHTPSEFYLKQDKVLKPKEILWLPE